MSDDEDCPRIQQTLDGLLAQMKREGREFGRMVRSEQGKPMTPEPVVESNTRATEETKAREAERFRIVEMWRLGLTVPDDTAPAGRRAFSWSEFFDRSQEEINASGRSR